MSNADTIDLPTDALVVIPRAELVFVPGGAEKVLSSIKEKARKEAATLDVSRPRDREAMRSLAYKLRRLKTTGDESGKDLKAEYQAKINPIDAERRVWRSEMDELIAEIIAPAEAFDAAEAARVKGHEDAIEDLRLIGIPTPGYSSTELTEWIDKLDHLHVARDWREFADRAAQTRGSARSRLLWERSQAEAREKVEAEAARLAAEEAARAQAEIERLQAIREAEIARQAAETARIEAEQAAAREAARVAAEAAERERVAAEALAREQQERQQAEERAARAEATRITDRKRAIAAIPESADYGQTETAAELEQRLHYLAKIDVTQFDEFAEEAADVISEELGRTEPLMLRAQEREAAAITEQARKDKIVAEALAEAVRLDTERRETEAAAVALEKERARVEGERIQQEAATRAREMDKAHRGKINREIVADLVTAGLTEDQAKIAVTAIAKGVRHCVIHY